LDFYLKFLPKKYDIKGGDLSKKGWCRMEQDLLSKNLELLRLMGYDEKIVQYPMLNLEMTRDGLPTLRYETGDGRKVYLHSKYNFKREWESVVKDLDLENRDALYIVYGLGLGHHIKELKKRISSRSYIFVIEKNLDIVSTYMQTQDFSQLVTGNVFFMFGDEEKIITEINRRIFNFNVMPLLGNLTNIVLPAYYAVYGSWIEEMQKKILDAIRHAFFMLGNDMEDTIIGIENNFANLVELIKSPSIELLENAYKGKPAIIVGAGPSLDKNIKELKKAQGKALILATDATLSTLKKHDILPDGVVSIERILLTYEKFYQGKDIDRQIVFIGPPVVRGEILETLKENKKLLCLKKGEKINEWINDAILQENRLLSMGSSCAHVAFAFAKHVGANPIIFVGQDLAYTRDGVTHSKDVEVMDKVDLNNRPDICFVEGINGEQLPTSNAFKNFLTWYELEIAADSGEREYLDATEGGARIKGTTIMPLQEVIEKYCSQPVPHLSQIVPEGQFNAEKYRRAYEELEKLNQVFDNIRTEASRHILRLDKLENKVVKNKEKLSPKNLEKVYKVLKKVKKVEELILHNDIARTLFQAPLMMAGTQVRMLGNEINTQNAKRNLKIQKKMVASVIIGCYSVQNSLLQIMEEMKNEELIGHKEEGGKNDGLGAKSYAGNLGNCQ